jgi:hypothetical protein
MYVYVNVYESGRTGGTAGCQSIGRVYGETYLHWSPMAQLWDSGECNKSTVYVFSLGVRLQSLKSVRGSLFVVLGKCEIYLWFERDCVYAHSVVCARMIDYS